MERYVVENGIGFAIIDGAIVFQSESERTPTLEWLKKDLGFTDATVEVMVRGRIFNDRVHFCVGKNYLPVELSLISASALLAIMNKHCELSGNTEAVPIYNGFVVGEPGTLWEPMEAIGIGCFYKEA